MKKLVSVAVSGGISILTVLIVHWDADLSSSRPVFSVYQYSIVGSLIKNAVHIY